MLLSFRIALIIGVVLFLAAILFMNKKRKLSVKYSIIWLFAGGVLLVFAAFPYIAYVLRDLLHVEVVSNLIFMLVIGFMLLIILGLSSTVSIFAEQIKRLSQNSALLEKRIRQLEDEKNSNKI